MIKKIIIVLIIGYAAVSFVNHSDVVSESAKDKINEATNQVKESWENLMDVFNDDEVTEVVAVTE